MHSPQGYLPLPTLICPPQQAARDFHPLQGLPGCISAQVTLPALSE